MIEHEGKPFLVNFEEENVEGAVNDQMVNPKREVTQSILCNLDVLLPFNTNILDTFS